MYEWSVISTKSKWKFYCFANGRWIVLLALIISSFYCLIASGISAFLYTLILLSLWLLVSYAGIQVLNFAKIEKSEIRTKNRPEYIALLSQLNYDKLDSKYRKCHTNDAAIPQKEQANILLKKTYEHCYAAFSKEILSSLHAENTVLHFTESSPLVLAECALFIQGLMLPTVEHLLENRADIFSSSDILLAQTVSNTIQQKRLTRYSQRIQEHSPDKAIQDFACNIVYLLENQQFAEPRNTVVISGIENRIVSSITKLTKSHTTELFERINQILNIE